MRDPVIRSVETLVVAWRQEAAQRRRRTPADPVAQTLESAATEVETVISDAEEPSQTLSVPEYARALPDEATGDLLDWLDERTAMTLSGRRLESLRDRFATWEALGLAQRPGRDRLYLRAAVLAIGVAGVDGEAPTSKVYVIRNERTGSVKIGISVAPNSRLSSLQTATADRLTLLLTMDGGADQERALHERFAASRLSGEWFNPTGDMVAWIEELTK